MTMHIKWSAMAVAVFTVYFFSSGHGAETPIRDTSPPNTNAEAVADGPLGKPGLVATYRWASSPPVAESVVESFTLAFGSIEADRGELRQWLELQATKAGGQRFGVWLLTTEYPAADVDVARAAAARYILQQGKSEPVEFRHQTAGRAVLPVLGGWEYLFPRADILPSGKEFPEQVRLLGHLYALDSVEQSEVLASVPKAKVIELRADVLIGFPHNTRQKDETRRYDGSDYEVVRLTSDDYHEMVEAGINCLHVDAEQVAWVDQLNAYYWGPGGSDIRFPECLYQSNYLGPALFMDEPAVVTRDYVVRPKLREDASLRRTLTPQKVVVDFQNHFLEAKNHGAPAGLMKGLASRSDVNLGDMSFLQQNVYSWETMVSSAIFELRDGSGGPPAAIVFEPPGRVGTLRTLPEMNMTYGCQIPVDSPKNLIEIIYGFLRGAARQTGKDWGMSIYGGVDRADAFWFQTHAYDLGATHFFYWDTAQLACVPYGECLALSRNLSAHAASHPSRDLKKLKAAGEVAILLPTGYNLGHVDMGKGNLWGLGELNLERSNAYGIKYREVMSNFFVEIERCIRLGVAYDLIWDVQGLDLAGYREVVRIREDGKVEVEADRKTVLLDGPRIPTRPPGVSPQLSVDLTASPGSSPTSLEAVAHVEEGSSAVYYTLGADEQGRYRNVMVAWELYGPADEDYRFLRQEGAQPLIQQTGRNTTLKIKFRVDQAGDYRLRAATVDMSGRTAVVWKRFTIE